MKSNSRYHPLTFQVTLTVLALAAFSLATVIGFGFYAAQRADSDSLERQKIYVSSGIADEVTELVREQASVTEWDGSLVAARAGDQRWMTENLGAWLHEYYKIDRVYVLDAAGRPIHAMRDGKTLPPSTFESDRATVEPSVAKLRALIREAADQEGDAAKVVSGIVAIEGAPAIVSVQQIVPDTDRVTMEPGEEYIHVVVQFVDGPLIADIADRYLLEDVHLLPKGAARLPAASVPLMAENGIVLGRVTWKAERPGSTLLRQISPALIASGLLAAGVLYFLLMRLRRVARELQRTQDEARYLALHDTLTGLPNRALFEDRMIAALRSVKRSGGHVALLYIDLDRFKNINDTFGHAAGDELVRQTAQRLQASVRPVDTVARLGGDEFAIIVHDVDDLDTARQLCDRLLRDVALPYDLFGTQAFVGVSIGVSISSASNSDPQELLREADIALYEAKRNGRGRHEVFISQMDEVLTHKRMIEADLRVALSGGGQMSLVYQPVYAADCVTLLGAEALVRWDHPVHGGLQPPYFVAIAEERGMIGMLGEKVLREAAAFLATVDLPWVSVNVSPFQLRDREFPAKILGILADAGIAPSRLQLEITEKALIEVSDVTGDVLKELRRSGIAIALDDFGTGYSSMSYLRRGAIDKLKIDRSLVKLLGQSKDSSAIVRALVDLAAAVQVTVTAEGVETVAQRDLLVAMGCNEFQGFLLSPALKPGDFRRTDGSNTRSASA